MFLGSRQFKPQQQLIHHLPEQEAPDSDLKYWGWLSCCDPSGFVSAPIGLSCFTSFLLMKEDLKLWQFIVSHWDILTPHEWYQLHEQHQQASLYPQKREQRHRKNDRTAWYDEESTSIHTSVNSIEVHSRLGHRLLWPLIRSLMSEVLSDTQVQILWDHFFTSPMRPLLINAASVAFFM